jgi:hypothetical protein
LREAAHLLHIKKSKRHTLIQPLPHTLWKNSPAWGHGGPSPMHHYLRNVRYAGFQQHHPEYHPFTSTKLCLCLGEPGKRPLYGVGQLPGWRVSTDIVTDTSTFIAFNVSSPCYCRVLQPAPPFHRLTPGDIMGRQEEASNHNSSYDH